ncbi:MAG: peptidoglycan-associated lipoprotein Pal [Zoogloea sp.]|nr:peptidoglycan-associated lipoprotein Pal [Zoogloea sp.]
MKKQYLLVPTLLAGLLAGCAGTASHEHPEYEQVPPAKVEDRIPGAMPQTDNSRRVIPVSPDAIGGDAGYPELRDPKNILSKRSVFFDFDSYVVKDEFKPLLEAHAKFLASHKETRMLIQGNADERGSREYNLALGQKRADAVRKSLALLGVSDAQVEAVSLGEEKPRCSESNEGCWSQNRRGDMLYKGEF